MAATSGLQRGLRIAVLLEEGKMEDPGEEPPPTNQGGGVRFGLAREKRPELALVRRDGEG